MASPSPRPHRPLVILALLTLLATACSDGPSETSSDGTAGGTSTTLSTHAQGVKFAECMRANGVADFPDPDAAGDFNYGVSVSGEQWLKTLDTCKDLQPPGSLSADRTPEQQSAALVFAQCIRDHGVEDFPDPVDGEPLVDTYKIPSSDTADGMAILNAAMQTCGDLLDEAARSGER